jgi:hypothetical protein
MLKTVSSITNAIGALNYKGTWNASTNTPTITSGVGVKGDYYVVSANGTTTIDGISNWGVGDWITFNGTAWQRVEGGADLNGVNLSVSGVATIPTEEVATSVNAYRYISTVTFTSSGAFTKATYPWLRAIRIKVVGGGGAGGGAAAVTTGQASCGSGAGSGAYAESFITNIAGLAASETVTIGAGGAGVAGAAGNDGSASSFGTLVVASGGIKGYTALAAGTSVAFTEPGPGGLASGCTGDFKAGGNGGSLGLRLSGSSCIGGASGGSFFGGGINSTSQNSVGVAGDAPGAGGSGAAHIRVGADLAAKTGGNGANGIVFVELFA